jgi:enterochelin esterase-like enzyme
MRYPQDVDGLVLLAPYLGEPPLISEIAAHGGVDAWRAPQPSTHPNREDWQRDVWRRVQVWSHDPRRTRNVWLAYGDHDRLRIAQPLLSPLLPPGHVRSWPGGHSWRVWTPALRDILAAQPGASAARTSAGPPHSGPQAD